MAAKVGVAAKMSLAGVGVWTASGVSPSGPNGDIWGVFERYVAGR